MRSYQLWLKQITRLGLILMMVGGMSGCSSTMSWKEEVKLHDGQIIVAKRYYNLGGYPAIESHNRSAVDETVTFNLPNAKSIVWKTDFRDSEPEPNSLNLIRFDVVKGVPYIATYPAGCIAYNKWGRPNPPQVLFKYEGEQWQRITLVELPAELINAQANVIVGRPDVRIAKSFYSVEGVNAANHDIHEKSYRTILREALPTAYINEMCMEMVPYKGSWVMPNDPIARKFIDQQKR